MRSERLYPAPERYAFAWSVTVAFVFFALVILTAGCSMDEAYVRADRKFCDVVIPAHRAYVEADDSMTPEQKERRERLLKSKTAALEEAERRVASE